MSGVLKAPFPWFGGKSRAAALVWERFGDCRHYIEPFAGSLAVLLKRPEDHMGRLETVNDKDAHLANLWRSVQYDPEAVIAAADWPVSEADLHARHKWLVDWMTDERRERFMLDPAYHEPQVAGWWLWGICQWIGGGWCELVYRRSPEDATSGRGTATVPAKHRQRPAIASSNGSTGRGVTVIPQRQTPRISTNVRGTKNAGGCGVQQVSLQPPRKRPMVNGMCNGSGPGIAAIPQRQKPDVGTSKGSGSGMMRGTASPVADWPSLIRALHDRLRYVRVCAGDWKRVVTPAVLGVDNGVAGVLLDPPYSKEADRAVCYAAEDLEVAHEVRAWCLEHGDHPNLRVALCGYEGEHDELEDHGWSVVEWKAGGGYGRGENSRAMRNRHRERIWFSPACQSRNGPLFEAVAP